VTHGVTSETEAGLRKALREKYSLRPLRSIETGKRIDESPAGTYFFVFASFFHFGKDIGFPFGGGSISIAPTGNAFFEIHHRKDGQFVLIGFAAEVDASRLQMADGNSDLSVLLSPQVWESQTSLLELPAQRFVSAASRELDVQDLANPFVLDAAVK
jgi:hypothetical protein